MSGCWSGCHRLTRYFHARSCVPAVAQDPPLGLDLVGHWRSVKRVKVTDITADGIRDEPLSERLVVIIVEVAR